MTFRRLSALGLATTLLAATASTASADGFRCGKLLVLVGDSTAAVSAKCGAPASADRHLERRGDDRSAITVTVDVWVYNFGPKMLMQEATFENGRLVATSVLGYGH